MSVEVSIICDVCGAIAAADKTAARARYFVRDNGGRVSLPDGLDACVNCVEGEHVDWRRELDRWRQTLAAS